MGQIRRLTTRWRSESGAQAVEFALILPVLLVLVLGIVNFAYLFGQKLALNQAVREGARAAVVLNTGSVATPTTLVQNAAAGSLIDDPDEIDVATSGACDGTTVGQNLSVTATYDTTLLVSMFIPFTNNFTLTGQAVFRCEW